MLAAGEVRKLTRIVKTAKIDARRRAGNPAYFKVQFHHPVTLSWMDVQRRFETADAAARNARSLVPIGADWRVMEIRPDGRSPVSGIGG